jgi:ribose 5-phosphate isomerase B
MPNIKIAIGADHAGFEYKEHLKHYLNEFSLKDFGTLSADSVDYADFAHPVADAIETGLFSFGILICGSANGVAITANKHKHIRAAICWTAEIAALSRKHNDANVLCIPARFVTKAVAREMVDLFMNTKFEGGRHQARIEKISC